LNQLRIILSLSIVACPRWVIGCQRAVNLIGGGGKIKRLRTMNPIALVDKVVFVMQVLFRVRPSALFHNLSFCE